MTCAVMVSLALQSQSFVSQIVSVCELTNILATGPYALIPMIGLGKLFFYRLKRISCYKMCHFTANLPRYNSNVRHTYY